jgi:hypothetical protein
MGHERSDPLASRPREVITVCPSLAERHAESQRRTLSANGSGDRSRAKRRSPHVRRSRVGLGVFSRRFYADGELIGEILGTVVSEPDYSSPYCYSMGDDRSLEPDAPFKFLNHSCQPNAQFDCYDIQSAGGVSERRVFVLASGSIRPGDEITIDYRWPAQMAIRCRCGSANCRGWVIDERDLGDFLAIQASPPWGEAKRRSETSRIAPAL